MANKYTNLNDLFTGIADAIRSKNNSSAPIVADDFPKEIENIQSGFEYDNMYTTSIPPSAFDNCNEIEHVNCYNLTSVGQYAFRNCPNLKTVILYDGVTEVGFCPFMLSKNVTVYCEKNEKPERWHLGWDIDEEENVVWGFSPVEVWDISATEEDNVVAKLYPDVKREGYYSLIIDGNGTMREWYGEDRPFESYINNITSVMVNWGIDKIGYGVFAGFENLESAKLGYVREIGTAAFYNCCKLRDIEFSVYLEYIRDTAFKGCTNIKHISFIGDALRSIGSSVFSGCVNLKSVTFDDVNLSSFGDRIFLDCKNLESINGNNVMYFGGGAVDIILYRYAPASKDKTFTMSYGVDTIAECAFQDAVNLFRVDIPETVTTICGLAFDNCEKLRQIVYSGTVSKWNAIFKGVNWDNNTPDYTIYCTDGKIAKDGTVTMY